MVSAQQQLDVFFDRFTPEMAKLGRKALAHMKRRLPGAVMMVYDNYSYLAIGFKQDDRSGKAPLSIALYPRWLNLFFLAGAQLPDPKQLLKGSGAVVRSIRITDAAQLDDPDIDTLISLALLDNGWRLDPKAKHQLVIKLASPKRQSRRPK